MNSRSVSFACIKYRCQKSSDHTKIAYIRIYMQIPHFDTRKTNNPAMRARQALAAWTPPELTAYKEMTDKNSSVTPRLLGWKREQQDNPGPIPGGFLVSLAWEEVSGTQLGDQFGSEAFWQLTQDQRQKVREALKVTLCKTEDMGYQPRFAGARNLVWDSASNTLFMVGFRECSSEPTPWTKYKIAKFGLAKIPETCKWRDWGWDGDTSSWVL